TIVRRQHRARSLALRQTESELGSVADFRLDAYRSPVQFHQLPGDGQPQTRPAILTSSRAVSLRKRFEHLPNPFGRNTDARISYSYAQPTVSGSAEDFDRTRGRKFDRVAHQVE